MVDDEWMDLFLGSPWRPEHSNILWMWMNSVAVFNYWAAVTMKHIKFGFCSAGINMIFLQSSRSWPGSQILTGFKWQPFSGSRQKSWHWADLWGGSAVSGGPAVLIQVTVLVYERERQIQTTTLILWRYREVYPDTGVSTCQCWDALYKTSMMLLW